MAKKKVVEEKTNSLPYKVSSTKEAFRFGENDYHYRIMIDFNKLIRNSKSLAKLAREIVSLRDLPDRYHYRSSLHYLLKNDECFAKLIDENEDVQVNLNISDLVFKTVHFKRVLQNAEGSFLSKETIQDAITHIIKNTSPTSHFDVTRTSRKKGELVASCYSLYCLDEAEMDRCIDMFKFAVFEISKPSTVKHKDLLMQGRNVVVQKTPFKGKYLTRVELIPEHKFFELMDDADKAKCSMMKITNGWQGPKQHITTDEKKLLEMYRAFATEIVEGIGTDTAEYVVTGEEHRWSRSHYIYTKKQEDITALVIGYDKYITNVRYCFIEK